MSYKVAVKQSRLDREIERIIRRKIKAAVKEKSDAMR